MLSDKKLFLFDIDGTVAIDETLIDGSRELFSHIDSIGGKSIFITNNSTKGVRDYMEKFRRMGVETDESNFITASYAAAIHLRAHYPLLRRGAARGGRRCDRDARAGHRLRRRRL